MMSQTQSKKLIRSLQIKVKDVENEMAGLVNSMESFVNKPIRDVALHSETGELSTERFRELSSSLDYVLSTLVEFDSQIQKLCGSASGKKVNDIADLLHDKILIELSNALSQRDECSTRLEKQVERMSQDSSELITQWEEKEKKIHNSLNHLMQKTDELSSNVTNQVNEQTKNTEALKMKIYDLDTQAEKNNCQISSLSNKIRDSCEGHENRLINLENKLKGLVSQNPLSQSLTPSAATSKLPDMKANLQTESPLQNSPVKSLTAAQPFTDVPIHCSITTLLQSASEKDKVPQLTDPALENKAISSPLPKERKTSFDVQNKEKATDANQQINQKNNTIEQQQPAVCKAYGSVENESREPRNGAHVLSTMRYLPPGARQRNQNMRFPQPQQPPTTKQRKSLESQVLFIMNRLTPTNFERLATKMRKLNIQTYKDLQKLVKIFFDKVTMETKFVEPNALLCKVMSGLKVPPPPGMKDNQATFRVVMLTKCQQEFEADKSIIFQDPEEKKRKIESEMPEGNERNQLIEITLYLMKLKRMKYYGNIRFIGELFKLGMLTENIMHDCIYRLLKARDDDSLVSVCHLLTTVGHALDTDKAKKRMDQYFHHMAKIAEEQKSRIKFTLQDVIDLRSNYWIPQKEQTGPKIIGPAGAASKFSVWGRGCLGAQRISQDDHPAPAANSRVSEVTKLQQNQMDKYGASYRKDDINLSRVLRIFSMFLCFGLCFFILDWLVSLFGVKVN